MIEKMNKFSWTVPFSADGTILARGLPDGNVFLEKDVLDYKVHMKSKRGFIKRTVRDGRLYVPDLFLGEARIRYTVFLNGEIRLSTPEHEDGPRKKRKSGYIDPNKTQLLLSSDIWKELDSDARSGEVLLCHSVLDGKAYMKFYYGTENDDIRTRPPNDFVLHGKKNVTNYTYYVNRHRGLVTIPLMFKKTFGLVGGMSLQVFNSVENGRSVIVVNMPDRECEITGNTIKSDDVSYDLTVKPETKRAVSVVKKVTDTMSGTYFEKLARIDSENLAVELLKSDIIKKFIKEELK